MMTRLIRWLAYAAVLSLAQAAWADSTSLLSQAQTANPTRYQFAVTNAAEIRNTTDNKAFSIWWQPTSGTPAGVIVTLHGHASYATDEFYLWQPYAQSRGYAILALQWWFGGGEAVNDYYLPSEMYPLLAKILKDKGVKPGTALFHGYSRGSANSYGMAALDTSLANRYFGMVLSNAGGAATGFPPNQQVVAGSFGSLPFAGVQWVMYCGELDPEPAMNGCTGMIAARDWVTRYGATVKLLIQDPVGDHAGFMTNPDNVVTALGQFSPAGSSVAASDCLFNWAEKSFATFFAPAGAASQSVSSYYYRYYPNTRNYLATNFADSHLIALGAATGGTLVDLGATATFLGNAGCVAATPPGSVTVSAVSTQNVGSASFGSSSKLQVTWTAPSGYTVDHYEVVATEDTSTTVVSVNAAATATSATLAPLKSATTYAVVVRACKDSTCSSAGSSAAVGATTAAEYWQLQGTGNTVSGLTKPVADGNARLSATRFGPEAGATANTVQFYYGPQGVTGQSVASSGVVSAGNPSSYLSGFTSYATTSGIRSPSSATSGIKSIMTGQGVPLSAAMGGKVRLFFESNDVDGKTRIYSVDSVDGYVGRDFNKGSGTTCSTSADYLSSGNCPATVVIGVAGDAVNPTSKINAARQNKIAWPTLTDWRWDGAAGAFMVFTIDQISGCTTASHNHGYAVWNGTAFVPQYDSAGCPKAFKSAQAALPMHIGDARYKMYFGDPSITTGRTTTSTLPFVGPKKLIYGDARTTGAATTVEFEDWEGVGVGRDVRFLWPNGEQLNNTAEGYIDDFHFLTPTGSIDTQVLYLSITDGSVVPFAATAVLLNP